MMEEKTTHKKLRIISVVAATAVSLACGTNVSDMYCTSCRTLGLTSCSMRTRHGHHSLQTSYICLQPKAMSSYGLHRSFPDSRLTYPGNRWKPRHVRIWNTVGLDSRQEEPTFGVCHRHVCPWAWILSNSHRCGDQVRELKRSMADCC